MAPKTVIKLMCWGAQKQVNDKFLFGLMSPVIDVGLPHKPLIGRIAQSQRRYESKLKKLPYVQKIPAPKPYSPIRLPRFITPYARKQGARQAQPKSHGWREKLKKMQEETERLDKELVEMEQWADQIGLEEVED